MLRARPFLHVCAALMAVACLTAAHPAAAQSAVSIKVSDEKVPPGAIAQMKVFVTEPKPISTGRGDLSFDEFETIDGIAVLSPGNDTLGVAVVGPTGIAVSVVSPSATFGTALDYPVVMVAGSVSAQTPVGSVISFALDPAALQLRDVSGALYPVAIEAGGTLTVAPSVSIGDVCPGSADLPAGAVVSLFGTGFTPDTEVRIGEGRARSIRYVNASRLDVVLPSATHMHGTRIRARNRRGSGGWAIYFSYQRTHRAGTSQHPVLRSAMPLFPPRSAPSAIVDLGGVSTGLALQNIQSTAAVVTAELFTAGGAQLAAVQLTVPANRFVVNEISELFHMGYSPSSFVRVRSAVPIQAMGIAVDTAGNATPLLPR